jgi:hypothetical protein
MSDKNDIAIKKRATFIDLYKLLQSYEENDIISWLKEKQWRGKDKQESLLRLFAGLQLIDKLKSYDICKGNYNMKTITKISTIKDIFYNEKGEPIILKDKGEKSDLTGICNKNNKKILVTSSKNRKNKKNEGIGKYDIRDIHSIFSSKYNGYEIIYCICTKNKELFMKKVKNSEECNEDIKEKLLKEDTIIIDWNDLNQAYHQFKKFYGDIPIDNIINSNKTTLCLKMHQHLGVFKTIEMKNSGKKNILWGHIQRSGKSYIIGGCIIEDSKNKDECNYLVITTAPNETIIQQKKVFDCTQLIDFNIIVLNGRNKKPELTKKNIIICSKQFLQTKIDKKDDEEKTKSIGWLKKMFFDMRFIDESHNGGSTILAQKTLYIYGRDVCTVQITATYFKPINDYNIPKNCWILWDLEDIKLCKNIIHKESENRLVEKHGNCIKDIISKYSQDNIINEYSKYPELWLLTDEINPSVVTDIINDTKDNDYGWSPNACFILKQGFIVDESKIEMEEEFQNEKENLKLWYRIFGKRNKLGIPDKDYPDNIVFMKRIDKICKNSLINSRFIGEGDFKNEPMIIMAFLPQNNINKISKATIKLLKKNNVIPDYEIISINGKTTNNPKKKIEEARIIARNSGKKGVLVLSGKQCSLGVSIDNCDIVLLLNNNKAYDIIYQMMFRCMTEGKNKKCGFVIDLNIHRVIETSLMKYASLIKPDINLREAVKIILQERLINLNGDHWMSFFGNNGDSKINALCENIYDLYLYNTDKIDYSINRLYIYLYDLKITKEEQKELNIKFRNITPTKTKKINKPSEKNDKENIKEGIEKNKINIKDEDIKEEKQINTIIFILIHIIPLMCLLTIYYEETSFLGMFELIQKDEKTCNILITQTKISWGESVDLSSINLLINIYKKYMKKDEQERIIKILKEQFMKNIDNSRVLSKLIDKYLIPQELEKKNNAEVSTPFKLRQEMLDKIPVEFWTSIKKVFEPCAGKGGFIIDIIDRFMNGLEKVIPDEKERYKKIVEECLYFSDINYTNIFICKLLIDPYNEYKLNYNEGNTLELDIKEKWDIEGFDAVIGNPPYESQKGTGDNKLYLDFTKYSINNLYKNGILLFITPTTIIDYIIQIDKNRKYLDDFYNIEYIALNTPEKYFTVSSTFTYFMLKKQKYIGNTIIEHYKGKDVVILKKGMKLPKIPSKVDLSIINKICSIDNCYDIKKCKFSNKTQRIRKEHITKNIVRVNKTETHKYKIYDTINKTNINGKYYYYDKVDNDAGKKRIIFSNKGYLLPFICENKDVTYSDNFSYILYENNLLELMKSKIVDYLIYQYSKNGFDRINCIKMIKKVNIKDDNIYDSFNLTKEEIQIIENSL